MTQGLKGNAKATAYDPLTRLFEGGTIDAGLMMRAMLGEDS